MRNFTIERATGGSMALAYPEKKNILVIQLGDIGDVVLATAAFRAVRETYPAARLSVLVRKGCGALLEADPNISETIEVARGGRKTSAIGRENLRLVRRLRDARYDLVIDLRTGDRGAILAFLTRAPARVGFYGSDKSFWRNGIFTRLVHDPEPALRPVHPGADQSLKLLRTIGIDTENTAPKLWIADDATRRADEILSAEGFGENAGFVTVNPFSRWKYKEWGYGKWAEVIDWLHAEYGLRSILVGSGDETATAAALAGRCGGHAFNFAGKTTLGELAALISRSRLHLGVDSAAPHIAAAAGTPTVTIFGPSDWRAWMVPDATHRVVTPAMDCVPCSRKGCDHREISVCLEEMGPDKVKAAIVEVLGSVPAPTTGSHRPRSG